MLTTPSAAHLLSVTSYGSTPIVRGSRMRSGHLGFGRMVASEIEASSLSEAGCEGSLPHRVRGFSSASRRARFRLRTDVGGQAPIQHQLAAQWADSPYLWLALVQEAPYFTFRWKRSTRQAPDSTRQAPEHSTAP